MVDTPGGRARLTFAPANDHGVLGHEVRMPSGETVCVADLARLKVVPESAER
ncbi:hypothetical protein AB0H28_26065 [Micromonospora sp. NPDC050980]|uniref:hypothetical protein n=1 Tax=Micromonospora sp. NPDC050980 TaxID=3155161 RepID=UPI0033E01E32